MKKNWKTVVILVLVLLAGLSCTVFSTEMCPSSVAVTVAPPIVTVVVTVMSGSPGTPMTPAPSTSVEPLPTPSPLEVRVDGVIVLTETVTVTFTVTGDGPQALLFDPPRLNGQQSIPASLDRAHFALLERITQGKATASLSFPRPADGPPWTLVFNPDHEPGDYVAPRVEMEVRP